MVLRSGLKAARVLFHVVDGAAAVSAAESHLAHPMCLFCVTLQLKQGGEGVSAVGAAQVFRRHATTAHSRS